MQVSGAVDTSFGRNRRCVPGIPKENTDFRQY